MRDALVPPKPKELVMAYSIVVGSPLSRTREKPQASSTSCRLVIGGAIWLHSASTVIPASRLPAPPRRWPVIDLVELTSRLFADSPKVSQMALASARSPKGVDVACAFRYLTSLGATP